MKENIIKKLSIRKGFITAVILLLVFNFILILLFYILILRFQITHSYQTANEELTKEAEKVEKELEKETDINKYLNKYKKNITYNIAIIDENNKVIFSSIKEKETVEVSKIVKLNNKIYLLKLSKEKIGINLYLVIEFIIFQLIVIILLASIGILGANSKILSPLSRLSKDLNYYKFGIYPKKRKVKSEIDYIQNDFVDLIEAVDKERNNQNRLIASISHDIKTPLTSILGYSERLITNNNLSDETKNKYINKIYNKSLSLKELTEEFDNYLSTTIKEDTVKEKIMIKHLVTYLKNYYKEDLKEKDIDFKIKTNCPNSYIEVDFANFKRIFSNTITNSIRHLKKDKKSILITINRQKHDKIKIEIEDNGIGTKEDLKKIFEPLYTTDKSRKISGLGLSICKEIVESHHGIIYAENNSQGGLSIIIILNESKEKLK